MEGPAGIVRPEQRGGGQEGFVGVDGGAGTQGEQAVDVGGEPRPTRRRREAGPRFRRGGRAGQEGAGPVRV
ncbi:hypothetical protein GA0115244_122410, partial [Streptomyces sp. DvalAA-19]